MNADTLNLIGQNKLTSRLTRWLLLTQEHDVHLNHIYGTSNLFSDALSRMPRLDDVEAYDCNNNVACTQFCYAVKNETPGSQPPFALDLNNIANKQSNDSYCAPMIAAINNQKDFNHESMSLNNNNEMLRTCDEKVVVLSHN